ncbi:IS1 family transposase, partial [Pseudoduganella namucuonensis]|uniref:IS1 family transposase n=1 Tax=Pseudoduganella namucuonensis TaxID=1035707 RepID=UPI0011604CE4
MKKSEFSALAAQLIELSPEQRGVIREMLNEWSKGAEAGEIRDMLATTCTSCPHCGGAELYRHGQAHGLPRYRCRACRKTF